MLFGGQPTPWSDEQIDGLRCRAVAQMLIEEIGADGPESAEDAAKHAVTVIQHLRQRIAALEAEKAEREAQEPVAWAWDDALGCMHAHCGSRRPVWVDGECSDAKRAETSLRPLYAAPPIPRVEQEPVAWVVGIDELAAKIASELARLDGFDPSDEHCGLYDLGWQGNPPEPMGDLFHLDYLPKGEAIAKAIGLPVIAIREPNEEECERIVESATRMLHSGDTFPEIGRRMFNAVREVMK